MIKDNNVLNIAFDKCAHIRTHTRKKRIHNYDLKNRNSEKFGKYYKRKFCNTIKIL